MTLTRMLALSVAAPICMLAQTSWTPYVANYTQFVKTTDSAGKTKIQQISGKEERSADGSLLRTVESNGAAVRGELWDASTGRITEFNYVKKSALLARTVPRKHMPPDRADAPVGSQTIAGVACVGYPSHFGGATGPVIGTVWLDEQDDIIMKTESDQQINGRDIQFGKTITSISFTPPDPADMKVPSDIQVSAR